MYIELDVGCIQHTQHTLLHSQVSSANLERSYRRAPKGSRGDGNDGDRGVEGAGICHLCMCGQGADWENLFLDCTKNHAFFQLFVLVVWWHIDDGDCLEWSPSKAIYVFLFPT